MLTTIEAVRSDYAAWGGKCVTLRGIAVGIRLYADREATIEPPTAPWGEGVRRSIVLYPRSGFSFGRAPRLVDVVGKIGSCKAQNDIVGAMQVASPDQIIMVSGYCHTSLEAYVEPVEVRRLSSDSITRLSEAEVSADRRELVDAPADLPDLAKYVASARELAAALATGNELVYRRLRYPEVQDDIDKLNGKGAPGWLRSRMREARADFRAIGGLRRAFAAIHPLGARSQRILLDRRNLQAFHEDGEAPAHFIVCWCRTADCAGRWPVRAFDADNMPDRPYLCVKMTDYLIFREGTVPFAEVDSETAGFAEPDYRPRD